MLWWNLPWREDTPLAAMVGWHKDMIKWDLLHTWYLGEGRYLVSSTIALLLDVGIFRAGALPARLAMAHYDFQRWRAANGKHAALTAFTTENLHLNSADTPSNTFKGSDIRLLQAWLSDVLNAPQFSVQVVVRARLNGARQIRALIHQFVRPLNPMFEHARRCFSLACNIFTVFWHSGLLLDPAKQGLCHTAGLMLLNSRGHLASLAKARGKSWYKIKPKTHASARVLHDLDPEVHSHGLGCPNPAADACWMDEDFVGKVASIVQNVSPVTVGVRALELYCVRGAFDGGSDDE